MYMYTSFKELWYKYVYVYTDNLFNTFICIVMYHYSIHVQLVKQIPSICYYTNNEFFSTSLFDKLLAMMASGSLSAWNLLICAICNEKVDHNNKTFKWWYAVYIYCTHRLLPVVAWICGHVSLSASYYH